MSKPSPADYPDHFKKYIDQVPEEDLMTAFKSQSVLINSFLPLITEEKSAYAYAEGKWTIKELMQHIIDTERIFCYRGLCIARKETASLPGFDENDYAANSEANKRSWQSLIEEFSVVRKSTELLYASFSIEALDRKGISNNKILSVASTGFICIGHFYHHKKILEERYLISNYTY